MSPEQWLAQQPETKPKVGLSPEEWLAQQKPQKPTARIADEGEGDFMRGLANIPGQIQNVYGAGKVLSGLVANKLGAKDTGKNLIQSGIESMGEGEAKQVVKESDEFLKAWEKGIGSVVTDWLPYQIGSGAGNIAETLAFMGIGAATASAPGAIAGALSKSLVKSGLKEAAEKVAKEEGKEAAEKFVAKEAKSFLTSKGATAGMVGQAGFQGAGETTGRAVEEAEKRGEKVEDIELSRVLPAAAAHAVADFFINKIGINALGVSGKALDNLALEVGKRIAITGTKELPAEEIQTMAERYGAKLSLDDAEAMREYINTAAASYAMSVAPGGIGGVRSHMAGQRTKALEKFIEGQKEQTGQTTADTTGTTTPPPADEDVQYDADTASTLNDILGTKFPAPPAPPGPSSDVFTNEEHAGMTRGAPMGGMSYAEGIEANLTGKEIRAGETERVKAEAQAYVDDVENPATATKAGPAMNKYLKAFGIEPIKGKGAYAKNLELLKQYLSGQPAVTTEPISDTDRTSAELAAPASTEQPATGAATVTEPSRVVSDGTTTTAADVGEGQQPTTLEPATPVVERDADGKLSTKKLIDAGLQATAEFDPDKVLTEEQEKKQKEDFYRESLGNGPQRHDKITPEQKEEYEETRKALLEEGINIPPWGDEELNSAAKDVYFSHIVNNTIEENMNAGRMLADYRKRMAQLDIPKEARRLVNSYENDRAAQSKLLGIQFPEWTALPADIQAIYQQAMGKATSGIESQVGFDAIAELVRVEKLKAKTAEEQKREKDKAKAAEEQKQKDQERKELEASQPRPVFATNFVPNDVAKMVKDGDLQGVLQYLRTGAKNKLHQVVAQRIFEMKLKTKIRMVPALPKGHLAEYDPITDTISVTAEGLTDKVLLHELTHAATVQVLNHYLAGRYKQLTPEQLDAAEHLEQLMEDTKPALGKKHREAYKNLYEFVSYAMTDSVFQADLNRLEQNETHATTILPEKESMWSSFKLDIAKLIGITKDLFKRKKLNVDTPVNYFMEVASAFEDILSVSEGKIEMKPLPAEQKENKKAPGLKPITLDSTKDGFEESVKEEKPATLNYIAKLFTTVPGLRRIASMFANNRYAVKAWEATHEMSKQIFHVGKEKMNNIYTQLTLSASQARNLYTQYVGTHAEDLNAAVGEFARLTGDNTEDAIVKLHKILEALHEPERRFMLYMLSVPLRENRKAGETLSPADARVKISKLLDTKKLKEKEIKDLRNALEELIFTKGANGEFVLDAKGDRVPNMANVDPLGSSPRITSEKLARAKAKQPKLDMLNINSSIYQVSVLSPNDDFNSAKDIVAEYEKHEHKEAIDKVIKSIQELHKATTALNKMANYWSQPVDNRVKFYGFENYIPMKGYSHNKKEEMLSFDTMRRGKELQELDHAYDGRSTVGKNPILQTLSDATRSALRAGRRDLTLAIRNAINQGLILGEVHKPISFEDRQNPAVLKALPRKNTVFHYNEDGSIQVLQIFDEEMRESIRRTYEQSKPIVELANKVTSGIGAMHTRYNYSFAPMNFVRDALTNAFAIGADMGPAEAANFIKAITGQVVGGNGLYKAMRVASMYQSTDKKDQMALAQMVKDDPYIAQMMEFIEKGGMVSYLQGLALKSNFQALHKEIGQSGIVKSKEQLDKFVDIWTDMFELASRSAAFGITKKNELGRLASQVKEGKMTQQEAEETATIKAAAYAKNLANFEQVGSLGRTMGAFYMFFRPAATGAVRAIEAIAPMWPGSYDRAIANLPPTVTGNAEALAEFKKNYAERQAHARVMTGGLIGLGSMAYLMAMMMSDDDELGRNAVLNDNMQQWTRFARFHIPRGITESMGIKEPVIIQVPWGFGMGAFAAAGAQLTGAAVGKTSVKEALANVFLQISLDSFVPLPISKMPPTEMPLEFFLDSIAPSVARPILEFALNKNGLGQDIYNDQNRRFGDAYTGGDKVPEIYKDAARAMANSTLGEIDISPNTLYFLANSYADGASRVLEAGYGITDLAQGRKGFNPKTDLPLFGSFFGAKSNVDSREFSAIEKKIQAIESKVKMFDSNPEIQAQYLAANPFDELIVSMYNKDINGELKDLRSQAKQIRLMQGLTPAERDAMLKVITFQQNLVKHNLIEVYKAYGISP